MAKDHHIDHKNLGYKKKIIHNNNISFISPKNWGDQEAGTKEFFLFCIDFSKNRK